MSSAPPERGRRDEYAEATRQALLAAARHAFAREGYQHAGIEMISRAARVTRGAFYHHFEDKKDLLDAVVVAMQEEAADNISKKTSGHRTVWDRLIAGIDAYLDICVEPAYARIVVQEAPVVLGHKRYGEIAGAHTLALLTTTLDALKRRGELGVDDVQLFSRLLDAVICEVANALQDADHRKQLRQSGREIIVRMLQAFRVR